MGELFDINAMIANANLVNFNLPKSFLMITIFKDNKAINT